MTPGKFTPRQRVQRALAGGSADEVPFTMYSQKIPDGPAGEEMYALGLCSVRRLAEFKTHMPDVKVTQEQIVRDGRKMIRTVYETPRGTLSMLVEPAGFTSWTHERMFKSADDYPALQFLLENIRVEADYGPVVAEMEAERDNENVVFRGALDLEPMQSLISGPYMDMQRWCMEWMTHRDEILALYERLVEIRRATYPIVAEGPTDHANYGGNVVPMIIGPEVFETYYVQHYNEAAEALHARGKRVGCHFDADCGPIRELIAGTDLDYVEAFTPMPDTDMTLRQAREAWPEKVLWLNFPSSVHLQSDERVRACTLDLLEEAGSAEGLLMGITEDIPEHRVVDSCKAILAGLGEHTRMRPEWYAGP
jgi:hypothetical protein